MRNVVKRFFALVFRILFRVRVTGDLRGLEAPRLLIVANHESFMDGLLLGLFLPIEPVYVVYAGAVRNPLFRLILSQIEYLPVDPASPMAMKKVVKLLESGRPVVIFPEGRLTVTGALMKVYDGPAFVAARTGATILPIRLDGPGRSRLSHLTWPFPRRMFPRVTISLMPTTTLPPPAEATAKARRHSAGEAMRRIMQKMMFDSRPTTTLYAALLETMAIYGRHRRVIEDAGRVEYRYGDVLKMTLALGRLVEKHSEEGENVGILMPNLAPTVGLVLGSSARGRVPAMLNFKAGAAGLKDACITAQIRTVFTSRAFVQQAALAADLAALDAVRVLYLEDLKPALTLADKLWIAAGLCFPHHMARPVAPTRPAVVLFTSGSEGKPKGVVLSHRALLSNIAQIRATTDFSAEDKVLNALPLFHSFGLTVGTLMPLMNGMRVLLYPTPLHYRVIPEVAYDRNCSVLLGTNTFLEHYAKFAHPYDFFRLRHVVAGAEKLTESVRSLWFEKFGIRILEGYGATETAPVLAVNTPMAYRSGTVGQFLPGIEHRIVPVPGIEQGGMLHVRGPNVMSGYLRFEAPGKLQPLRSSLGEGWYDTGDVVSLDEEGFVSIVGRVKRFAKVAGEMVSLEVVERLANQTTPQALHAASTKADGARGEAIVLFTTDGRVTREALSASARELGIPEIAIPRKILRVDAIPLLGTGKVDYVSLKNLAEAAA